MKKLVYIILLIAIVVSVISCKKNDTPAPDAPPLNDQSLPSAAIFKHDS